MTTIHDISEFTTFIKEKIVAHEDFLFRGQPEDDELLPKFARGNFKIKKRSVATEKRMFVDFKKRGRAFLKIEPQSELDWLALAQHHGMAIRLLDWTKNPLAALWFTVRRPSKEKHGIIWIFKITKNDYAEYEKDTNPFSFEQTKVFHPTHIAERFSAQQGWFTIHDRSMHHWKKVLLKIN